MYSRDYVYVRRYSVDEENNVMVLVSRYVRWLLLGSFRVSFIHTCVVGVCLMSQARALCIPARMWVGWDW